MTSIMYTVELSFSQLLLNAHNTDFCAPPQFYHTFLFILAHRSHHSYRDPKPPDRSNFLCPDFSSLSLSPFTSDIILYYSLYGGFFFWPPPHYWSFFFSNIPSQSHTNQSGQRGEDLIQDYFNRGESRCRILLSNKQSVVVWIRMSSAGLCTWTLGSQLVTPLEKTEKLQHWWRKPLTECKFKVSKPHAIACALSLCSVLHFKMWALSILLQPSCLPAAFTRPWWMLIPLQL